MKREEFNYKSSGIPFEKNCAFYAPLSKGDFTDHVSGAVLQYPDGQAPTWDVNEGMYLFTKLNTPNERFFSVDLQSKFNLSNTQDYTLFCVCRPTANGGTLNFPQFFCLGSYANDTKYRPSVVSHHLESSITRSTVHGRAYMKRGNYSSHWVIAGDQAIINEETLEGSSGLPYPNNWTSSNKCYSQVTINPKRESRDSSDYSVYIKEIMIFNRQLTANELVLLSNVYQ